MNLGQKREVRMVTHTKGANVAGVCWQANRGVAEVLVIDYKIRNASTGEIETQVKFPAGGQKPGETFEETVTREFKEEVGLRKRKRTPVVFLNSEMRGRHHKVALLFERRGCKGDLSTHPILDGDAIIEEPRFISIDEAIDTLYRTKANQTYYYTALKAKEYFINRGLKTRHEDIPQSA